jgi:hypothetical protein
MNAYEEADLFILSREDKMELKISKLETGQANLRKGTFSRITENTKEIIELKEEIAELRRLIACGTKTDPIKDISICESTKRCQMIFV